MHTNYLKNQLNKTLQVVTNQAINDSWAQATWKSQLHGDGARMNALRGLLIHEGNEGQ